MRHGGPTGTATQQRPQQPSTSMSSRYRMWHVSMCRTHSSASALRPLCFGHHAVYQLPRTSLRRLPQDNADGSPGRQTCTHASSPYASACHAHCMPTCHWPLHAAYSSPAPAPTPTPMPVLTVSSSIHSFTSAPSPPPSPPRRVEHSLHIVQSLRTQLTQRSRSHPHPPAPSPLHPSLHRPLPTRTPTCASPSPHHAP